MIAFIIDGERPPYLYHVAVVCEKFGLGALGILPDTRTILQLHQCLSLAEGLTLVREHMRGKLKTLPPELMSLAHEVLAYKYRSLGQEPPSFEGERLARARELVDQLRK